MIRKIKVNTNTRAVSLGSNTKIGVQNDNKVDKLYFEFDEMIDGIGELLTDIEGEDGVLAPFLLEKEEDGYSLTLTNQMLNESKIQMELRVTNGTYVWNSKIFVVYVIQGLETGSGSMPSGITIWLQQADNKLEAIQEATEEVENLNIEATKESTKTTITITKKDGTTEEVEILDGAKGDKGEKGDPGAIKMIIVNILPATGTEDTIYLLPVEDPEARNNYEEYVYVNNNWEKLGGIQVEVDLTDYAKLEDLDDYATIDYSINTFIPFDMYSTADFAGVMKTANGLKVPTMGNHAGEVEAEVINYSTYSEKLGKYFISKGTLENVITGKDLTTKTYVDEKIGDIESVIDLINGETLSTTSLLSEEVE